MGTDNVISIKFSCANQCFETLFLKYKKNYSKNIVLKNVCKQINIITCYKKNYETNCYNKIVRKNFI